jgi:hypothetical protein
MGIQRTRLSVSLSTNDGSKNCSVSIDKGIVAVLLADCHLQYYHDVQHTQKCANIGLKEPLFTTKVLNSNKISSAYYTV